MADCVSECDNDDHQDEIGNWRGEGKVNDATSAGLFPKFLTDMEGRLAVVLEARRWESACIGFKRNPGFNGDCPKPIACRGDMPDTLVVPACIGVKRNPGFNGVIPNP